MCCRGCRDLAKRSSQRCPPDWGASATIGWAGGIPIERLKRLSTSSCGPRPLSWPVDLQMLFASPCIRAQSPQHCPLASRRPDCRYIIPLLQRIICLPSSVNSRRTPTEGFSTGAASLCLGDRMARMRRKDKLPTKLCAVCGRLFVWRKKWARNWVSVKYCSDRCRAASSRPASAPRLAPS